MAQSIGNLALILSANSSQFSAGLDAAKAGLKSFGDAVAQTMANAKRTGDAKIFAGFMAEIREMKQELGGVRSDALTQAFDKMTKAADGSRAGIISARREYEELKRSIEGTDSAGSRARASHQERGWAAGSGRGAGPGGGLGAALPLVALGAAQASQLERFNQQVVKQFGQAKIQGGDREAAVRMDAIMRESERSRIRIETRERDAEAKRRTVAAMTLDPRGTGPADIRDARRSEERRRAIVTRRKNEEEVLDVRTERKLAVQKFKDVARTDAKDMRVASEAEAAFQAANAKESAKLDKERKRQHDLEAARAAKVEAGTMSPARKASFDVLAREGLEKKARDAEKRIGPQREWAEYTRQSVMGNLASDPGNAIAQMAREREEAQRRANEARGVDRANRAAFAKGEMARAAAHQRLEERKVKRARDEEVVSKMAGPKSAGEFEMNEMLSRAGRQAAAEQIERAKHTRAGSLRSDVQARWDERRESRLQGWKDFDTSARMEEKNKARRAEEKAMDDRARANRTLSQDGLAALAVQAYIAYHALNMLRRGLYNIVETSAQFEYQIKRFQVVTRASSAESQASERQVRDIAKTGIAPHLDLAKAQTRLGLAGLTVEETKQALPTVTKLALMSGEDPATVADSFTVAIRAMGISAKESAQVGDVLALANTKSLGTMENMLDSFKFAAPYAKAAGMSLEELSASLAVLSNAGLKGELGGTVMRGMLKKTANQSAEAASQMKRLGISFQDAQGKFIGMGPMLKMLADRTKDLGELQSLSVFSELFDARAATGVLRLVDQAKQYKDMYDMLKEGQKEGLLSKQADEMLGTMLMKINKMKAAWMEFKLGFASLIMPASAAALEKITNVLQGNIGAIAGTGLGALAGGAAGYRFGGVRGAAAGLALGGVGSSSELVTGALLGPIIASGLRWALPVAGMGAIMAGGKTGAMAGAMGGPWGMAIGAGIGVAIGALTMAITSLTDSMKAKEAAERKRISEHTRELDKESDFEKVGEEMIRKERVGVRRPGKDFDKNTAHEMMIGGLWTDVRNASKDDLERLRQQVPGKDTAEERRKRLGETTFGRFTLAFQEKMKAIEADDWTKKKGAGGVDVLVRKTQAEKDADWARKEEFDRARKVADGVEAAEKAAKERERQVKALGIQVRAFYTDDTTDFMIKRKLKEHEDALGPFKDFGGALLKEANPLRGLDLFDNLFPKPQTEQEATDQTELQRIFDRNTELNRVLLDQSQAARMAAQGHSELYEAHRAGLPWLDLESAKIRLTGENLGKLAQLELDMARVQKQIDKGRPGGNYGTKMELLVQNKAELERAMRSQAEAAVQGEKQKVWDDTRLPMETHLKQVQKLDSLVLKAGMDWDTYARGIRKAGGDMDATLGSMSAWKAGSALEAGSAQAITAQNQSRYGEEVSSGRQSEEHLREMRRNLDIIAKALNDMGGAAGVGSAIAKAVMGGDGILK